MPVRHHRYVPDEELATDDPRALRIRFAADPASVPGARRFVADGLRAWGHADLVDDATLCVSELAGNAALHGGSSYIDVGVQALDRVVRVFVEDDGPVPVEAVSPRTTLPVFSADAPLNAFEESGDLEDLDVLLLDQPATGRGLAIVSVLASDWGVETLENGKRVWADLGTPVEGAGSGAKAPDGAHVPAPGPDVLPPGWTVVRLAGCPVELSLQQDQHLDELVRELTLISADHENPESAAIAHRLDAILRTPAHARLAGRRQAMQARDRGERLVDVEMAIPREFSAAVTELHAAVIEADVLCDEQRLLTLTSPRELREFRTWMTEQIVDQVERDAEPVTWDDWRSRR